jgi:hypothetical protein
MSFISVWLSGVMSVVKLTDEDRVGLESLLHYLRPSKIQQNISGRLTSENRTRDRYRIRGYLSTAAKHGRNMIDVLREAG